MSLTEKSLFSENIEKQLFYVVSIGDNLNWIGVSQLYISPNTAGEEHLYF